MSGFEKFHPIVLFTYYLMVILFSIFSVNPVVLVCVLVSSLVLFCVLNPFRVVLKNLGYYLFFFLLLAVVNPLFNHRGETPLFFMNDNPVTLEALAYGVAMAAMLTGIMFWCKSYQVFLSTDKFLYLFGKTIPGMSLILSMVLRFIPLFKRQTTKIGQVQKAMGFYTSNSLTDRFSGSMRIFDSLLTWSLENSIETADAMKARGYGLPGRTNFSLFRFHLQDGILLTTILLMGGVIGVKGMLGDFDYQFYPAMESIPVDIGSIFNYGLVLLFLLLPSLLEIKEKIQWKYLTSKI